MGFVRNILAFGATTAVGAGILKYAYTDRPNSIGTFSKPPLAFPGPNKEITDLFKRYVTQELASLGKDPTRDDSIIGLNNKRDMTIEQELYVIERFSDLKEFSGSQGNAPATIARDMASSFRERPLEQAKVIVDACLKSPCDYLYYRRGEISFGNKQAEEYAASQDKVAFVQCAKESPSYAQEEVRYAGGPRGVKTLLTQEERDDLYCRAVESFQKSMNDYKENNPGSEEKDLPRGYGEAKNSRETALHIWNPSREAKKCVR